MKEKTRGIILNIILYIAAFAIALIPFIRIENIFASLAAFTATATLVIYIVTCFYPDTSLYDPYWSVAPPVMLVIAIIKYKLYNANAFFITLFVFVWALRLTANWAATYKGLGHEDWRYAKYRQKYGKLTFALINFAGLQFIPTIVVYAGLVGAIFSIQVETFTPKVFVGLIVMLAGTGLEYVSDKAIHEFLRENSGKKLTCRKSIWKYTRHPNYLGELMFWCGIFLVFLALRRDIWYYGLGFLLIIALFLFISIPMMEKHNMERRVDYEDYKAKTSMLIPLPPKNTEYVSEQENRAL